MIMKKLISILCFVFIVYGVAFSQGHGTVVAISPFKLGGDLSGQNRSVGNIDNFSFSIITNNEDRIHISANGNVGIGTTTPTVRLECVGQVKITGGSPGINKVLTSDAVGLGSWILPSGGGFTDDGAVVRLTTITDNVGIGTSSPNGKLEVRAISGVIVGGFLSGQIHITNPGTDIFDSAGISGHNLNGGNKQLWFVGSDSPLNDDIAIINRQGASLKFYTNNISRMTIDPNGNVSGNQFTVSRLTSGNLRLDGNVFSSEDANGPIFITPNGAGAILLNTDRVLLLGSSIGETGDNSELMEMRDSRVTTGSAPNYIFAINRQNSATSAFWLGNNGNGDGIIITNNQPMIFGNDVVGAFTERMRIEADGRVGIGTTSPDVTALLDLASTTLGFLQPRMTTVEKDAIVSPKTGLSLFDLTLDKPVVRTSSEFKTLLTEDIGQVVVQETFASTNVRFFGELALPATQGWTDNATGSATIDLETQVVFGVSKQVVRHNDNVANGAVTSSIALTAQNWIDINAFGASYSGTSRLDTNTGISGFFSGLQANSAENPLATGNRRYGVFFDLGLTVVKLGEPDGGTTVQMDGTNGNPFVSFDDWFSWECVIPPGLGPAQFYVNGILTTFFPQFRVNTGGLGTNIQVGSGSTGGTNRVVFHDNFGVTIYEEAATKTLAAATMVGDVAQINIPEGKRDYTIILPDGNPRLIGAVLKLVVNNLLGTIELQNENPAAPEILYNGLRTLAILISAKETIEGVNTFDLGNVYTGFDIGMLHVGGKFIDTTDQLIVTADTPQVITFNINKILDDVGHAIGSSVFFINTSGKYKLEVAPQVFQGSGAAKIEFWLRRNGVDILNSGVQIDIGANSAALPILIWKEDMVAGDTVQCVWASNSANTKLDNLTSLFGGPNISSIKFRLTLIDI